MFKSMQEVRKLTPALAILPEQKFYPRLGGLLRAIIHPNQTIYTDPRDSDAEVTKQILVSALSGDNHDSSDPESLAADIYNTSRLHGNSDDFNEATQALSAELEYQVATIEDDVLPIIKEYQEVYTRVRASTVEEDDTKYRIKKYSLPTMFRTSSVDNDSLRANLRPGSDGVGLYELTHLSEDQFATLLNNSGDMMVSILDAYKHLDQSKSVMEHFNDYAIGGTRGSQSIVERMSLNTIGYIIAKTMVVYVPDNTRIPPSKFKNLAADLLSNVSRTLINTLPLITNLSDRNVILEVKPTEDKTTFIVSKKNYKELALQADSPSKVKDMIIGYYLLDSSGASINSSSIEKVLEKQSAAMDIYKSSATISNKLLEAERFKALKLIANGLLLSSIKLTPSEEEFYKGHENGNPDRTEIIKKKLDELTLEDLMDDWNRFIVDVIIDARFPFIPSAKAYINASIEEAMKNGLETSKETLTLVGVTAIMLETIVSSFRY